MSYLFALLILGMACVGVLFGALMMVAAAWVPGWRRWLAVLGGAMVAVGIIGFLGQAFSAVGGLNWLPRTFEWPAGSVDGMITTPSGLRVVPTTAAGRVQVYDAEWNFIRGWHIGAGASGAFALRPLDDDRFEVFTARGDHHYVFSIDGELISEGTYPGGDYSKLSTAGQPAVVPTSWWLWVFTNPLHGWLVFAGGFALFGLACIRRKRQAETEEGPSAVEREL
jgi:hypothetical protein